MAKDTKDDVHYGLGHLHSHCGPTFHDDKFYCRHFTPGVNRNGGCELVAGPILPDHGCDLYRRIKT